RLAAGRIWPAAAAESPRVAGEVWAAVDAVAAAALGAHVGSAIALSVEGRTVRARVSAIYDPPQYGPEGGYQVILPPNALAGMEVAHLFLARAAPGQEARLQLTTAAAYPTVTPVRLGEVLENIQSILDRLGFVVRFIATASIAAGLILMGGSIAATRRRRQREAALWRVLGASARTVICAWAIEFSILGAVAGAVGAALAQAAAALLVAGMLDLGFGPDWGASATAVGATVVLSILTGLAASAGILRRRPLAVLRHE
ncbi:MAG TPA: FtsX-like permease family protein, partial [Limnochordia bacterium]